MSKRPVQKRSIRLFPEREAAKVAGVPEGTKPRNASASPLSVPAPWAAVSRCRRQRRYSGPLIETGEEQLKRGMGVMQKNYEANRRARRHSADAPPSAWR